MRFFFRSRGFKIIVAVAAALIAVSVICAFFGKVQTAVFGYKVPRHSARRRKR